MSDLRETRTEPVCQSRQDHKAVQTCRAANDRPASAIALPSRSPMAREFSTIAHRSPVVVYGDIATAHPMTCLSGMPNAGYERHYSAGAEAALEASRVALADECRPLNRPV